MKKQIHAVIIDDEEDGRKVLSIHIQKYYPEIIIDASIGDALEALVYLKNHQPNIVFLDIEMPRMSGFELLQQLGQFDFKVIFVTAYDRYMLHAIKVAAFDYLIKPVDKEELVASIQRLQNTIREEEDTVLNTIGNKLIVPIGNGYEFIDINDIVKCESSDNYTYIYLQNNRKIHISKTLKYVEELLPEHLFLRCHSKYLISIQFIAKYVKTDGGFFELTDKSTIPISRTRKDEILKKVRLR